jgi:hypothetical protein
MILIFLGNVGSGKTACAVREMYLHQEVKNYSNIKTNLKNNVLLDSEMICKKQMTGTKKTGEPVYEYALNIDFWKDINEPINVILDEAHSILNSRRAMSKVNIIVTDWIALIRRVLGEDSRGMGDLILITQLPQRIDVICREMATQVRYHCCHYVKRCNDCGSSWNEDTDMPEVYKFCPNCDSINMNRTNFSIEVKVFPNVTAYTMFKIYGMNTFFKHYFVNDIVKYFPMYNTLQWDNMFSDLYY